MVTDEPGSKLPETETCNGPELELLLVVVVGGEVVPLGIDVAGCVVHV